jgi:3-oxoacyl-[acyl-carrier protein] reductase
MPNKTAIVTGSSRGIGRSIAVHMAKAGFAVTVNYTSKANDAAEVVAEIEKSGGRAIAVQADVSDSAAAAKIFDQTEKAFGPVDVLVNNAGVIGLKPIAEMQDAEFDRLMNINVRGSFNMMRLASKRLRDNGRIINFSSSALIAALPGYAIYNATKGAVEAMTKVLAKELGSRHITVNAVAPGPVATELFLEGKPQELIDRLTKMIPLGRIGEVEDIAPIVVFLAGPESAWINGQTIRANGGIG